MRTEAAGTIGTPEPTADAPWTVVITTLNPNAAPIAQWSNAADHVVLVGDRKSSEPAHLANNTRWIPADDQPEVDRDLCAAIPWNHYARKMLGYIAALDTAPSNGRGFVFDTDDDNAPLTQWQPVGWSTPREFHEDRPMGRGHAVNVYQAFVDQATEQTRRLWPRGFPLRELRGDATATVRSAARPHHVGVWQGLADLDPDVDAIHRLIFEGPIRFKGGQAAALRPHDWCPFNSQATAWPYAHIDLAYLPATVSMRWTDILRGYVAQRLLWERGLTVGFYGPAVVQHRNEHDLLDDLAAEYEMYQAVPLTLRTLDEIDLSRTPVSRHLETAYGALAEAGVVRTEELGIVQAWNAAIETRTHRDRETAWTRLAS